MDHFPAKLNTMGQLHQECISDMKSRFWQIGNQTVSRTEVICPKPRHATRPSCALDGLNWMGSRMKGFAVYGTQFNISSFELGGDPSCSAGLDIHPSTTVSSCFLPMPRGDCGSEILDMILSKDDSEDDLEGGGQTSFFCGSPPVRTGNPVVRDAQFTKQIHYPGSPLGMKSRVERGSPSCCSSFGGSPKMRIEGFALA